MSTPPPLVCPRCQLPLTAADGPAPAAVGSGTMTVHPDPPPAPATPRPGVPERVGRFEVRRFIGEGSFGRVYEAYDPALKRAVALKVAKPEQTADAKRIERFQGEAQSAGLLLHPNIVAVFDSGSDGPHHYIASAFVPGRALADVIDDGQALPPVQAAEIGRKLADALAYAHRQGVVHRDVKPGNVMRRDDGEPLLMDFGLAARADDGQMTLAGPFMGTPAYAAPEQWTGQACPASDQYSLGCLLYELLTGRPPFGGSDAGHFMVLHTQAAVPRLPAVPRDLEAVVLKCLEKEPTRRYADCAALAEDLRRWLAGEPVTARRAGLLERLGRWAAREPVVAGLAAMVVAVLTSSALVSWRLASWALTAQTQAETKAREAREGHLAANASARHAEFQAFRAEDARHAIQMDLALRAWELHDVVRAERILGDVDPRFRLSWETRHVFGLCRREAVPLQGHTGGVRSAAYSPDGSHLVGGGQDGTLKVWDTRTGRLVLTLTGHDGGVWGVAFSPDGQRIVSGSDDRTLKLWDAARGQETMTLEGHTHTVTAVAFSRDGTRVVSASKDGTLKIWEADSAQETLTLSGHDDEIWGAAFSQDGTRVVSASKDGTLKIWETGTGQEVQTLSGHTGGVTAVAYNPDGTDIVSGTSRELKVWDARTGQLKLTRGVPGGVTTVAFSPDGTRIVSGDENGILTGWDAATGKLGSTLRGHTAGILGVAISRDGTRIVSASADGSLRGWDSRTSAATVTFTGHAGVPGVAFSPDGRRFAAAGGWGLDPSEEVIAVWDARTGQEERTFGGLVGDFTCAVFNPHSGFIASGSRGGTLRIWDALTGEVKQVFPAHEGSITSVAFRPDGARIATSGRDGKIKIWDSSDERKIHELKWEAGWVTSVAFSPDGRRVAGGGDDRTVRIWDADSGRELFTLRGHRAEITCVAFSPDGTQLVGSVGDGTVHVWDAETGSPKYALKGHEGSVTCVAFSPDGTRIASGGKDGSLMVWDTSTGQHKINLKGHSSRVAGVAFSPDGRQVLSGSEDTTLKVWDVGVPEADWHDAQARSNASLSRPFATAFHLERLHRLLPHDAAGLRRLQDALAIDVPGLGLIRDRHRAFTLARAAALIGPPPLALPVLLP